MKEKRCTGFSLAVYTWGDLSPPYGGGGGGGQSVNGEHRPNFDRLYHKLKVLLMLYCNCMMQFIGYDSIKTH